MINRTGFLWDEHCFWHSGGNYAQLAKVGGLVQPLVSGGLPEAPETKRRLRNLIEITGLSKELQVGSAPAATTEQLLRVHPEHYLAEFKRLSDEGGGELGLRTPFGPGAYEIAALSAGLVISAVNRTLDGDLDNAYALARPPGHHCLPEWPNGFCLLSNVAIAAKEAIASGRAARVAIVDWDVHHGNGTEAIFYDDPNVLTISLHQERCYPQDTGHYQDTGRDDGVGYNMNIPLAPGGGDDTYVYAMEKLVMPRLQGFDPELIIVACGFDASSFDPLSRMMCMASTFETMTKQLMQLSDAKLVLAHEGGYSEMYVPFCGHAVLEALSGSTVHAEDPMEERARGQQPNEKACAFHRQVVDELVDFFAI